MTTDLVAARDAMNQELGRAEDEMERGLMTPEQYRAKVERAFRAYAQLEMKAEESQS